MNKSKGHLKASTVVKINNLAQSVGWPIVPLFWVCCWAQSLSYCPVTIR